MHSAGEQSTGARKEGCDLQDRLGTCCLAGPQATGLLCTRMLSSTLASCS